MRKVGGSNPVPYTHLELETVTNMDLRRIIDQISVNKDGNVRIILKKLDDLDIL